MNHWIFALWMTCFIQNSSAALRVIRSTNTSKFIHQDWDYTAVTENTVPVDYCMNVSDSETEGKDRTKRSSDEESIASTTKSADSHQVSELSEQFLKCEHSSVEQGCYEILSNGSVHVPLYKTVFPPTDHIISKDTGELFVCSDFLSQALDDTKFSETLATVSLVGTFISSICILLHAVMFLLLKKLRNLPGYCLFALCISLQLAYICSFVSYFRTDESDCTANGIFKAFGLLSSFFWMNVMSYDIWRSLRLATAKLRLTSDKPRMTRFGIYSAYAWGSPLFMIIVGFIVNSSPNSAVEYRLLIAHDTCWFLYRQALLVYFVIPLIILLCINILFFISCFYMVSSAAINTAENKADLWLRFLVCIRLSVVMGLTWIFAVLASAVEVQWLWYLSVICNVLQGVFIFFSFTFSAKTRLECKKAIQRKKSSFSPPTQTSSSQQSTSV
ncbi:g_PROTEIN_RECEP_F2_4 domain-containing protein [Nephila pilipes]|uniref:G_PROTEIN_RECEP_F2_4 domain-containing protein n=1 Tax=Nephila pilipes TaxID=299642 RepID=A0A8X6P3F8_NEPPI|nr:g_PROTEIN_RECEP_F2_4 domain-containing protein [Nephila pilipes]